MSVSWDNISDDYCPDCRTWCEFANDTQKVLATLFPKDNVASWQCIATSPWVGNLKMDANPDISGPGMIVAFMVPAYITIFALTLMYFYGHQPESDPFRTREKEREKSKFRANPIDKAILSLIPKKLRKSKKDRWPLLERASNDVIMYLADMQVLTGLAILISGFSTLNTSLTTYHWEILVSIAWFSSVTHLSALTFLRNHLYNHQAKRLRIVFTSGVVVLMLIVALVPTGYGNINEYPAIPALCNLISPDHFAIKEEGTEAMDIMISAMFLILVSYVMRVFKLFRPLSEWMSSVFKGKMGRCGRRPVDWLYRRSTKRGKDGKVGFGRRLLFYLLFRPVLAGAILIKLTFDFISSMAFEVHWVAFSATWGTIRVVWLKNMIFEDIEETDRTRSADPLGAPRIMYSPDTMEWSFGQVPAVTMLVAPLKSIHERFYEYRLARKRIKEGGVSTTDPELIAEGLTTGSPARMDATPSQSLSPTAVPTTSTGALPTTPTTASTLLTPPGHLGPNDRSRSQESQIPFLNQTQSPSQPSPPASSSVITSPLSRDYYASKWHTLVIILYNLIVLTCDVRFLSTLVASDKNFAQLGPTMELLIVNSIIILGLYTLFCLTAEDLITPLIRKLKKTTTSSPSLSNLEPKRLSALRAVPLVLSIGSLIIAMAIHVLSVFGMVAYGDGWHKVEGGFYPPVRQRVRLPLDPLGWSRKSGFDAMFTTFNGMIYLGCAVAYVVVGVVLAAVGMPKLENGSGGGEAVRQERVESRIEYR